MLQVIALLSLHKASIPEVHICCSPARMLQVIALLSLHKASIPEVHICCSPARMLQVIALSVKTPEPEKKIKKSPRMANVFIICKSQWRIRPYRREEVKDKNKLVQRWYEKRVTMHLKFLLLCTLLQKEERGWHCIPQGCYQVSTSLV